MPRKKLKFKKKYFKKFQEKNLTDQSTMSQKLSLTCLPDVVLENIFRYFSYCEIANLRIVCKKFDQVCQRILNAGYHLVKQRFQKFIEEMERLGTIPPLFIAVGDPQMNELYRQFQMTLLYKIDSMFCRLDITLLIHVKENRCCFFAGKVLDEIIYLLEMPKRRRKRGITFYHLEALDVDKILALFDKAIDHWIVNIFPEFKSSYLLPRITYPSSGPFHFSNIILNSICGNFFFMDSHLLLEMPLDAMNSLIKSLREQLQVVLAEDDDAVPPRSDEELKPEGIFGMCFFKDEHVCLIKWQGRNIADFVPLEECKLKYFQVYKRYLDKKTPEDNADLMQYEDLLDVSSTSSVSSSSSSLLSES